MTDHPLPSSLERTVTIDARRATVFRYFTDSARFAAWWGEGSRIDPRPGGEVVIRYPGGTVASGHVVEILDGERVVFTYGYASPGNAIPPGGSRVTVTFTDVAGGTRVTLRHDLPDDATRDAHVPGWRYQLSLFANVVAREAHADVAAVVDRFFSAWNAVDPDARRRTLEGCTTDDVVFRDGFAAIEGRDDLVAHLAALAVHMPGLTLARTGAPRQCQGTALVEWVATGPDGAVRMRGTNVVDLAASGRITRVVGLPSDGGLVGSGSAS